MRLVPFMFRPCIALVVMLLLVTTLAGPALANPQAQKTLQASVDQILQLLRDPLYKAGQNRPAQEEKLRVVIKGVFDFKELTRLCLGIHWQKFNAAEQEEAADAMADLLEATYIGSLRKYDNQQIAYDEIVPGERGAVEVRTRVVSGSNAIPIAYRMKELAGWRVYDVVIEGVSLVKNYRTQFQEIMLKGTPQELIAKLREKAATTRAQSS